MELKTFIAFSFICVLSACAATVAQTTAVNEISSPSGVDSEAMTSSFDYVDNAKVVPAKWPQLRWPITRDAATESRIAALIGRMSIEEKVGQLIQADIGSVTPDDLRRFHLGSVLNGGNSGPKGNDLAPARDWLELADAFYSASVDKTGGRIGIPVIWGTDAVHGHSNIVGATIFPHNIGLGAARDPGLIERIGRATAAEIRVTGMEWTFAPTLTVPQDYRWGRAYEGYSSDPELVASYARSMIRGLQGRPSATPILQTPHVIASTKHFIADGGTTDGRDQGDAAISEEELIRIHGAPYVPAIEEGVATIMTSFSSWQGDKIAGHRGLMTDVLKERMNFGGFIVSDWNAHGQVKGCTNESCPRAVNAGLDMYMAPDSWKPLYHSLVAEVKSGRIPMVRLDDAVARILRVKMRLGLFEAGRPSSRPLAGRWSLLGAADHRAIAREAVRKSLVLLKHENGVLPIKPGSHLLVTGEGTDDVARQSGGWTLTWQGTGVNNSHFPGATSIWKGLHQAMRVAGGTAELSVNAQFRKRPDAAIVIFGETPYAEFQGDLKALALRDDLRGPYVTMRELKKQGIPVIALMITGRPLFTNPELNIADAFVVAWLPGSEGSGISDLLVAPKSGKPSYDFTGKLPTSWPATAAIGTSPLFEYGYGLNLTTVPSRVWKVLDENPGVDVSNSGTTWFQRGQPAAGWSFRASRPGETSTRITAVPVEAQSGDVRISATDHQVQEGARRVDARQGVNAIELTTHEAINLSREANGDVMLVFTLRLDTPVTGLTLAMDCEGTPCRAELPVGTADLAPVGQWATYGVMLKCFENRGVAVSRIAMPFQLTTTGQASYSLSRVALDTNADRRIACPASQ